MQKTLLGKDVTTGSALEVVFDQTVDSVRPSTSKPEVYLSPGWIDVQVNGLPTVAAAQVTLLVNGEPETLTVVEADAVALPVLESLATLVIV